MYSKCGSLKAALDVFREIPDPDVYAYTSLITGLADHGQSTGSIELFHAMVDKGVRPNHVTFLSVLAACGRVGLVREGLEIFRSMEDVYGVVPGAKHYGCLVDLLGRAGLLEQAEEVVRRMGMERPDPYATSALLNAYRVHGGNAGRGVAASVAERRGGGGVGHSGVSVLLSNVYASLDEWDGVARIRKEMVGKGVKKVVGYSR